MTSKKTPNRRASQATIVDELEVEHDDEPSAEERLESFFSGIGGDSELKVSISELDPDDPKRRGFLFSVSADELDSDALLSQILEAYGPGLYEALAKGTDGRIKFRQRFNVGSVKKKPKQIPQPLTPTPAEVRSSSSPAPATTDPALVALLESQGQVLRSIADALNNRPEPPQPKTLIEQAQDLAALREFLVPPPAPATNGIIETVRDVLSLRDELGGGGGGDPFAEAMKSLIPVITRAVDRMDSGSEATRRRAMQTATELGGQPQPAQPQPTPGAMPQMSPSRAILTMYLGPILTWAEQGAPATGAAEQIAQMVNQLPDHQFAAVFDFLEADDVLEELEKIDPRVANYKPWLADVVAQVLALFPPTDEEPDTEKPERPVASGSAAVVDSDAKPTTQGNNGNSSEADAVRQ